MCTLGASVAYVRATRTSLPCTVRTRGAGRPRRPHVLGVPHVPRTVVITPGGDDDDALTLTLTSILSPTLTLNLTLTQVRRLTEPSDLFAEAPPKAK